MSESTLDRLVEGVRSTLRLDVIGTDVPIGELGFDSMNIVELIVICDQIYQVPVNPESIELTQYTTLRDLDTQYRRFAAVEREGATAR